MALAVVASRYVVMPKFGRQPGAGRVALLVLVVLALVVSVVSLPVITGHAPRAAATPPSAIALVVHWV